MNCETTQFFLNTLYLPASADPSSTNTIVAPANENRLRNPEEMSFREMEFIIHTMKLSFFWGGGARNADLSEENVWKKFRHLKRLERNSTVKNDKA